MLREWPRLRTWLEEDADGRRLHLHLMHAARGWQSAGRDPAELYRGARLASALEWSERHEPELDGLERAFVAASRAEAQLDAERQRRANRRLRVLLAGVGAMLALAVVAGVIAVAQRGQAREATVVADAQRVGAEAVGREQLDQALLLARAGVELHDSAATRGNLLSVLVRNPAVIGVLPGDGWPLHSVAREPRTGAWQPSAAITARSSSSTSRAAARSARPTGSRTDSSSRSGSRRTERRWPCP